MEKVCTLEYLTEHINVLQHKVWVTMRSTLFHRRTANYLFHFFIIKPTRCNNFPNFFWHETLHVSGSTSAHRQEFIHSTLGTGIMYTGLKTAFEQDLWSGSLRIYGLDLCLFVLSDLFFYSFSVDSVVFVVFILL